MIEEGRDEMIHASENPQLSVSLFFILSFILPGRLTIFASG